MSAAAASGDTAAESAAREDAAVVRLAPIAVATTRARVAAFQRACGGEAAPGGVPLIFPISWLACPEIRARLVETAGPGRVPVHESQSFTLVRRLELDCAYRLDVTLQRTSHPERLTVAGEVTTPDGEFCLAFETILRLIGLDGQGA